MQYLWLMARVFIVLFVSFSLMGSHCKVEPPLELLPDTFSHKFVFVNHDLKGNDSLLGVGLTSYFYNITTDSSNILYQAYNTMAEPFNYKDSIIHRIYNNVKVGSRKKFVVQILYRAYDKNGSPDTKGWRYESSISSWGDTIKSNSDTIEIFHWPEDTAKYFLLKKIGIHD